MHLTDDKSFHILTALARVPLHGYAIRQEIEARTEGAVRLGLPHCTDCFPISPVRA